MPHSNSFARGLLTCSLLIGLLSGLILPSLGQVRAAPQQQAATHLVISQVYGGGGNSGALFQNDFVELFNPTGSSVSLDTWSIQYASGNGTGLFSGDVTPLSGTIASGGYYLVQLGSGSTTGLPLLPTPDVIGTTLMGATAGKVILANTTTGLACNGGDTPCTPADLASIVDLVGYGTTSNVNFFEGTNPAPVPSTSASDLRIADGCVDTDDNSADFSIGSPNPRNTTIANDCNSIFTATAAFNQTSTALAANQTGTAAANLTGTAFGNETATSAALTATSTPPAPLSVVINEVAWSGTAASSSDEWMELYNPGSTWINLTGWKLTADSGQPNIALSGVIAAGGYFLLERTDDTTVSDITADLIYTGELSDLGDKLRLLNPNGIQIDTANIDGGAWPAGSKVNNRSMERYRPNALDAANNWVTNTGVVRNGKAANGSPINGTPRQRNWAFTVTLTSTPRPPTKVPTKLPTPVPRLVINEFLPRAGFDWNQDGAINTFDEFIEIANDSGINVSLSGWRLQVVGGSSKPYTLPNLLLKPGDHALFYGKQTNLLLSDGGGTIQLVNPRGVIMDAQTYGVVLKPDQSWCRLPDTRGSWYSDCFPTPNQTNSRVGTVPSLPPGTGLEAPVCLLPDTLPVEFRQAECYGYGANMWQAGYWNREAGQSDRIVPQNESKWETFVE